MIPLANLHDIGVTYQNTSLRLARDLLPKQLLLGSSNIPLRFRCSTAV